MWKSSMNELRKCVVRLETAGSPPIIAVRRIAGAGLLCLTGACSSDAAPSSVSPPHAGATQSAEAHGGLGGASGVVGSTQASENGGAGGLGGANALGGAPALGGTGTTTATPRGGTGGGFGGTSADPARGGSSGTGGLGGTTTAGAASGGITSSAGGATSGQSYSVPRGASKGCGIRSFSDKPGEYTSHDIDVMGVDSYWLTMRVPYAGQAPYTFTHRSFSVRLPRGYDPQKAYPLVFQGGGCGNTDGTSGKNGADKLVPDDASSEAIAVGLSYVYPDGAGACFADDGENTYELPYWDAVYAAVTASYCVDLEKVFIGGFSSGAWMAYTVAFARAGLVRGIGTGAGGMREKHPARSIIPFAAFMVTGLDDDANPIHRTKDGTSCTGSEADGCWKGKLICGTPGAESCFDTGSAHARDEILKRNGCVGTDTVQHGEWSDCRRYTGCPAAFPVVYCTPPGGHTSGDDRHNPGTWNLWKALPAVP
ncbi:MAG TPA: hypothetical protein VFQ61_00035 [Polyangiaceae bacterium]|nr:hypothetical protein [Polyangiaceae bacterium]